MNEYFINIGKDLASKLPDSHFDYNINGVCNLQLSVFNKFTNEILFNILKETSLKWNATLWIRYTFHGSRTKSQWTKTHRTISKRTKSQEDKHPGGQNPRGTKSKWDKNQGWQKPRGTNPMEDNIPGYRIQGGQNPKISPRMMHLCIKARKIHDYR